MVQNIINLNLVKIMMIHKNIPILNKSNMKIR